MKTTRDVYAVIPAKSKSTRFPGKNMALLDSIPLFLHAVDYAKEKGITPVVFTDSEEIKKLAEWYGANTFPQTEEQFEGYDALVPAIEELHMSRMVLLQPTCPFHKPGMLEEMERRMDETGAESIYTCEEVKVNGHLGSEFKKALKLEENVLHRFDGNLILCTPTFFLSHGNYFLGPESLYLPNAFPYTWDIDYEEELVFAEHIYRLYGLWDKSALRSAYGRYKEENGELDTGEVTEMTILIQGTEDVCPYHYIQERNLLMPLQSKRGYTIFYIIERRKGGFRATTITGGEYTIEKSDDGWVAVQTNENGETVRHVIDVAHPRWRRKLVVNTETRRGDVLNQKEGFDVIAFVPERFLILKWDNWGEEQFTYKDGIYHKSQDGV